MSSDFDAEIARSENIDKKISKTSSFAGGLKKVGLTGLGGAVVGGAGGYMVNDAGYTKNNAAYDTGMGAAIGAGAVLGGWGLYKGGSLARNIFSKPANKI